jgi:hypothetical protein
MLFGHSIDLLPCSPRQRSSRSPNCSLHRSRHSHTQRADIDNGCPISDAIAGFYLPIRRGGYLKLKLTECRGAGELEKAKSPISWQGSDDARGSKNNPYFYISSVAGQTRVVGKDESNRNYLVQLIRFSILDSRLGVGSRVLTRYAGLAWSPTVSLLFSLGWLPHFEAPDFIGTSQFLRCLAAKPNRHFAMLLSMLPVSTFLVVRLVSLAPSMPRTRPFLPSSYPRLPVLMQREWRSR